MIVNLSSVLSEPHQPLRVTVDWKDDEIVAFGGHFPLRGPFVTEIQVAYDGGHDVSISGKGSFKAEIPCDRCLELVEKEMFLDFQKKVTVSKDGGKGTEDSDEINYIEGYNFDVEQLICNELLVGWPMKILCSDNCRGICNVCGQNLNEGVCDCESTGLDPRMSVIQDVFKNFKEV